MIDQYIKDGVIAPCSKEEGDYINTVFLREKKDSTPTEPKYRMILNMKQLNKSYVDLLHHKITSLQTCLDLLEQNWFMASIDLSNAFHTVPMHEDFTKYLKFIVEGKIYKYLVLPMGFRDSPRLFCKLLKPVLAHLRRQGYISSIYIDDFFLTAKSYEECQSNVKHTLNLLQSLGFDISDKSSLEPAQTLHHLGFVIDSTLMIVYLHESKVEHISCLLQSTIKANFISIKQLASVIGTLVAAFPGVLYGPLYYRELELVKIKALKVSRNYDRKILLEQHCKDELTWWLKEGINSHKPISHGNPDVIIQTDASNKGWGALLPSTKLDTQGLWSIEEQENHINVLELKAALLGIKALCVNLSNCHLQVQIDNTTAVAYINNMGGTHSMTCNSLARALILWCKKKNIWLSACHIAGTNNKAADDLSRNINEEMNGCLTRSASTKFVKNSALQI